MWPTFKPISINYLLKTTQCYKQESFTIFSIVTNQITQQSTYANNAAACL